MQYYFPVILVVVINALYHICSKAMPANANPLALLIVTYLIAAVTTLVLFFITDPARDLISEMKLINWAPIVLGFSVVGLEFGFILLYRVGWDISLASLVCNILLALVLIVVGILFYKEHIHVNQIIGIVLCVVGLVFINK